MSDDLTPERRAELRELLAAATDRPWVREWDTSDKWWTIHGQPNPAKGDDRMVCPEVATLDHREDWTADVDLIVAAVSALPALLDAADERDRLAANPRDEYHTMDELYEYRMLYNALAANAMPDRAVKSWRHSDGGECFGGGWFVVYLNLPTGQVSNHYKAEHWDLFRVPEVPLAPEWDGHTPADAADRLVRALDGTDDGPTT